MRRPTRFCFVESRDTWSWCKYAPPPVLFHMYAFFWLNEWRFFLGNLTMSFLVVFCSVTVACFSAFIQCINRYPFAIKNSRISPLWTWVVFFCCFFSVSLFVSSWNTATMHFPFYWWGNGTVVCVCVCAYCMSAARPAITQCVLRTYRETHK